MKKFTFLTKKQVFGDKKLDIIRKKGTKSIPTDFSILLGGSAAYWTKSVVPSDNGRNDQYEIVDENGKSNSCSCWMDAGTRPVIQLSGFSKIPTNGQKRYKTSDDVYEVEYGYYPQQAATMTMQKTLEQAYEDANIKKTGNKYTASNIVHSVGCDLAFMILDEYNYNGERYVRMTPCFDGAHYNQTGEMREYSISNGGIYKYGDVVWIKVEPIKWLVDKSSRYMLADKILYSDIPIFTGDWDLRRGVGFWNSTAKDYLQRFFAKEITQIRDLNKETNSQTSRRNENEEFRDRLAKITQDTEGIEQTIDKNTNCTVQIDKSDETSR